MFRLAARGMLPLEMRRLALFEGGRRVICE